MKHLYLVLLLFVIACGDRDVAPLGVANDQPLARAVVQYPVIDSAVVNKDGTITVVGSSFGHKDQAAPLLWANFEEATPMESFHPQLYWFIFNTPEPTLVPDSRHANSQFAYRADLSSGYDMTAAINAEDSADWFVSYWLKVDSDVQFGNGYASTRENLSNIKMVRWHGHTSSAYDPNEPFLVHSYYSFDEDPGSRVSTMSTAASGTIWNRFNVDDWVRDSWSNHSYEFSANDIGQDNGILNHWYRDQHVFNEMNYVSRDTAVTRLMHLWAIGPMNSFGYDEPSATPNYFWMDEIYVDNTLARVEVAASPDYDTSQKEVQIPFAWSDSEIRATVNGDFDLKTVDLDEGLYVHVTSPSGHRDTYMLDRAGPSALSMLGELSTFIQQGSDATGTAPGAVAYRFYNTRGPDSTYVDIIFHDGLFVPDTFKWSGPTSGLVLVGSYTIVHNNLIDSDWLSETDYVASYRDGGVVKYMTVREVR